MMSLSGKLGRLFILTICIADLGQVNHSLFIRFLIKPLIILIACLCSLAASGQTSFKDELIELGRYGYHHDVIRKADSAIDVSSTDAEKIELLNAKLYSLYVLELWHDFKVCVDQSLRLRKGLGQTEKDFTEEYIQLIWYYQAVAKFDSTIWYGEKSVELLKKYYNRKKLARAYNLLAYSYTNSQGWNRPKALPLYDSARNALGEVLDVEDSLILARWYHNMGNQINNTTGDSLAAMSYYDSSLWIYEKYNDPSKISLNTYVRAFFMIRYEYDKAYHHFVDAWNMMKSDGRRLNNRFEMLIIPKMALSSMFMYEKSGDVSHLIRAYELYVKYVELYTSELGESSGVQDMVFFSTYDNNTYGLLINHAFQIDSVLGSTDYVEDALYHARRTKHHSMNQRRKSKMDKRTIPTYHKNQIGEKECMLEYFYGFGNMYCVYTTNDKFGILNLGSSKEIIDLMNLTKSSRSPLAYEQSANALYERLVGQLPLDHDNIDKFIVIRDAWINSLAFEQLIVSPNMSNDFRSLDYFTKHHAVEYHYSFPNFEEKQIAENVSADIALFRAERQQQSKLPYTSQLLDYLMASIDVNNSHSVDGTIGNFLSVADNAQVVHISAHAEDESDSSFFAGTMGQNMDFTENFENSGIYFSDGKLVLENISGMDLSGVNLLVAHGCETDQGIHIRNEGAMSISRAFFEAGVRSIVSSEWKIDDQYSSMILKDFYDNLEDHPKPEALRQAKLKFIREAKSSEMANPLNWAGLVYIGHDDKITLPKKRQFNYAYLLLLLIPVLLLNYHFKFHHFLLKK